MSKKNVATVSPKSPGNDASRPISALLSQVLVAFTIEFDNEFERRMGERGYPGARLSLIVWSNCIRFIPDAGITVEELATKSLKAQERIKHELGCLERWGVIALTPGARAARASQPGSRRPAHHDRRAGWGSGRGIRADWIVRLTPAGLEAKEVWPPLFHEIEQRWVLRFGKDVVGRLRESLQAIVERVEVELPHGLPSGLHAAATFPPRVSREIELLSLPTLLSQALLVFAMEFDRDSPAPLALCANALRVLEKTAIPVGQIPQLTGGSPEASGIGWRLKPYVVIEPDRTRGRGKVVRFSPLGLKVQQTYLRLIRVVEKRWESRFEKERMHRLRESLQALFDPREGSPPPISAGLIPPQGVARAGGQAPSLGRRKVASAARQRNRDLIAQTASFVRDPAGTLPHYPLWDMNRGFGP